jgi:hypothetical protein
MEVIEFGIVTLDRPRHRQNVASLIEVIVLGITKLIISEPFKNK